MKYKDIGIWNWLIYILFIDEEEVFLLVFKRFKYKSESFEKVRIKKVGWKVSKIKK